VFDTAAIRGPVQPDSGEGLADRSAVCRLAQIYALGVDLRDEAMVQSVFAPDAIMRGALGEASADEYVPMLLARVGAYEATMHNITNQYAVVEGNQAELWSYAVALHFERPESGRADLAMGVQYRDRLTRTERGWLISDRQVVQLWVRTAAALGALG
jgi:hypothetical protein